MGRRKINEGVIAEPHLNRISELEKEVADHRKLLFWLLMSNGGKLRIRRKDIVRMARGRQAIISYADTDTLDIIFEAQVDTNENQEENQNNGAQETVRHP